MREILVEACVESLEGALAAEEGGAGRVELCVALEVGGLTPPDDLVAACVARLSIPVFVLVRPRAGSFVLSTAELAATVEGILRVTSLGAGGIVAGALTPEGRVDVPATAEMIAAAGGLPFTFHRAFDEIADQVEALEALIGLGVRRVLTSGGAKTAEEGAGRIGELVRQAAGRIGILAGGSVRAHNAAALVRATGVTEVHSRTPEEVEGVRELVLRASAG